MLGWFASISSVAITALGLWVYFFNPCLFGSYCEFSHHTYILSEDQTKRTAVIEVLPIAKERFEGLFTYTPINGALLLDRGGVEPLPVKIDAQWRLRYDPSGPKKLRDVLNEIGEEEGAELYLVEGEDIEMSAHGLANNLSADRSDTTAHEICHAYFSNMMGQRSYPDVLEEIAAISCESDQAIDARVDDFNALFGLEGLIAWDEFLALNHPIKAEVDFAELLSDAVDEAQTSLSFTIDNETELGRKVDIFYAQSALFISIWKDLCPNTNALTDMSNSMSSGTKFSEWLRANALECSPNSLEGFQAQVAAKLRQV